VSSENIWRLVRSGALELEKGSIRLFDLECISMTAESWFWLLEELHRQIGDEAYDLAFRLGRRQGRLGVRELGRSNQMCRKSFLVRMVRISNLMGMGRVRLEKMDTEKGKLLFSVEDSPLVERFETSGELREVGRPIHDFWRGLFHASSSAFFGSAVKSREVKCEFLGGERCLVNCTKR